MSKWTIGWLVIIGVGFIWEFAALLSREPGATLSEHVWKLRGQGFYSLILFFLIWMIYHFVFEGKGGD